MPPRALIVRAPGTNCDEETAFAFERAGAVAQRVHIRRWLERPALSDEFQILCLPGGFSYGDDVAAGRILANQIRHHLAERVEEFLEQDKLILGICNGLQILLKSGLLVPEDHHGPRVTLTWNDSGRFEDRWVTLDVDGRQSIFLRDMVRLELPIAHAEGKFVARDQRTLDQLSRDGCLTLRYTADVAQGAGVPYPYNPNGSMGNVAAVADRTGRMLGMMPHPERHLTATHHPAWTRRPPADVGDGLKIFANAVSYFG
ncbi:MAG: phosphoribosylformylglycinamidine synthase I [Pirellulales bacterium]